MKNKLVDIGIIRYFKRSSEGFLNKIERNYDNFLAENKLGNLHELIRAKRHGLKMQVHKKLTKNLM